MIIEQELFQELIDIRRQIHLYPELGFEEEITSKFIEDYLINLGLKVERIAKTGIVGLLVGGLPGPVVAIRADMDCLPIQEETEVDYKSKYQGKMHACGHDGHVSILLCTAKNLVQNKCKIKGQVKFIFQPAEESEGGALPMILEGALENPRVEKMYALHLWSMIPIGKIGIKSGPIMGATCEMKIEIMGIGGHGALPQDSIDPIVTAASFIQNVQTVISRNIDPLSSGVISFGTINGGSACNVIASKVTLSGTIRCDTVFGMEKLKLRVETILKSTCVTFGATSHHQFNDGYPALINNESVTQEVITAAQAILGINSITKYQTLAAEDFAFFAERVPSCYFFLGAQNPAKQCHYPHHHPKFNIDEDALLSGMKIFTKIILGND